VTNLELNRGRARRIRAIDVTHIPSTGRSMPSTTAEALRRAPLPESALKAKLRNAGLRPTVQRMSLSKLLFSQNGDRHVSAEALHAEAREAGLRMSLSTVYNALNQFAAAGLLRQIAVQGPRTYFHTRTSPHNHFIDEATGRMFDAADDSIEFARLPAPPEGMEIVGCDVIIRLKRKRG